MVYWLNGPFEHRLSLRSHWIGDVVSARSFSESNRETGISGAGEFSSERMKSCAHACIAAQINGCGDL
jgi:hypothetical protein